MSAIREAGGVRVRRSWGVLETKFMLEWERHFRHGHPLKAVFFRDLTRWQALRWRAGV